jgi:hypothetical protein
MRKGTTMKKYIAALALLLGLVGPALAQWQVPDHAVPIGRGPGFTGFKNAAPGTAGLPLVSNGAAADPSFQQTIASANKVLHVSTTGNDANDGLSWATAKLTIQAGIDTASTVGKVLVGAGTYTLSTPVYMRAGIALECVPGAIITQANSANLQAIVDFSGFVGGNTAHGASIRYCTIDGNRANNPGRLASGNDSLRLIYYGNSNNVTIDNNIIRSGPGYGVHGASQTNLVVSNNTISDVENHSIFMVHSAGNFQANCRLVNNFVTDPILIGGVNGCLIVNNSIIGRLIGTTAAPLVVNTSGTAVTWVSGPNFSTVKTGDLFITSSGAVQIPIEAVNSTTSLTLDTSAGTLSGVSASIGTEDLIGIGGASRTIVANNYMKSGVSFGLSLFDTATSVANGNVFVGNVMEAQGKNGFASIAGNLGVNDTTIVGNIVIDALQGGTAVCNAATCNSSYSFSATPHARILLDGNIARDANGNTGTWLNVAGLAAGSIHVGSGNAQSGAVFTGINGSVSSITLSAGWGNTAAVTTLIQYGHSVDFVITANGTGIAANPTFTVNTVAGKPMQGGSVAYLCKQVGGTGALTVLSGEHNSTAAQIGAVTFNGTPVAASTYRIICT